MLKVDFDWIIYQSAQLVQILHSQPVFASTLGNNEGSGKMGQGVALHKRSKKKKKKHTLKFAPLQDDDLLVTVSVLL